jgi:hypothetical protein
MVYELVLLPVAVIVVVLIFVLDVPVREAPRLFNVKVAPHAFVVQKKERRKNIDKARNLREVVCPLVGGGIRAQST